MQYKSGPDHYHVRNLRVVIDGAAPDYGAYPVGFYYDSSTASGTAPGQSAVLGQAYDGGSVAQQWSVDTDAYVSPGARTIWYFTYISYAASVILHWDEAPDLNGTADTSTADLWVNGTDIGDFTTLAATSGWRSRSVNITAQWNGGVFGAGTSTADVFVNGFDVGDYTTPTAANGWGATSQDVTTRWKLGQTNKVEIRYKSGAQTYHVRSLRAIIDGGAPNYGQFPLGYSYDATTSLGKLWHLGQGYDGSGTAAQYSMQTLENVSGFTYITWHFPAGWLINAVGI